MKHNVTHLPDRRMFTITADGGTAYVEYTVTGGVFDIVRTFVPKELRGRRLAETLVESAYSYAEDKGYRLCGSCTYASYWLLRNQK